MQAGACKGEAVLHAAPNAVDVLSNVLVGDKLREAQQLVGSLLNPNAEARAALVDVNVEFL